MDKHSKNKAKPLEEENEYQKLVHRVFVQNEDGAKLLGVWMNAVTMTEGHSWGKDPYDLGRAEGRKEHVREVYLTTKQAENR